jgi:hypothetical protein
MLFIFAGHETCSYEWQVLSSRTRTAPRTPRYHQKHRWAQQLKTGQKEQQSHRSLSLRRKRRSPIPAPRTRLKTKRKKRRQRKTEPSTQPKTPQPTKTERQKRPLTIQPKKPLTKRPWKEKRHHCKRVLAKSNGTLEGHHDFTEVGVSPSRTQPVISVSAFGQVTFL